MMRGDRGAEPSRSRVHEEPQVSSAIAIEFDEVIATTERAQVSRDEAFARVLERAGREWPLSPRSQGEGAMGGISDWNFPRHSLEPLPQLLRPQPRRGEIEANGAHAAAEISTERRRNDRVDRREHAPDRHAIRDVEIRHRRHVLHHVRLRRELFELLERALGNPTRPHLNRHATLRLNHSGHATPTKVKVSFGNFLR